MVWLKLRLEGEARSSGGGTSAARILVTPAFAFFVRFHFPSSVYLQLLIQLSSDEYPDLLS